MAVSAPVIYDKNSERYSIGYKLADGNVIPLSVKSPINYYLNDISWYNKNSAWKMGLDISKDKELMKVQCSVMETNRGAVKCFLGECCKERYLYQTKFSTREGTFETNFYGTVTPFIATVLRQIPF